MFEAVISALSEHAASDATTTAHGLACLVNLLAGSQDKAARRRERAVDAGAIETTLAALAAHPHPHALAIIGSLASGEDTEAAAVRRQKLIDSRAFPAVCVALAARSRDPDVQVVRLS